MKISGALALSGSMIVLISLAAFAQQQQSPPAAKPTEADAKKQFAAMVEKNSAPTEAHKALAAFVGEFDERSEVLMGPTPIHAHGSSKGQWIMDGRFVRVEGKSAPDEELKGERLIVYGYDPGLKKYTVWQVETGSLVAITGTGDYDAATKTFTFEGELPNKMPFHWIFKVEEGGSMAVTVELKRPGQTDFAPEVRVKRTKR